MFAFKLLILFCSIFISIVKTTPHHCCSNGIIKNVKVCDDGTNVSISCNNENDYTILLNPSVDEIFSFSISTESNNEGRNYLDAYEIGFHVYQPYFCTGQLVPTLYSNNSKDVAIVCGSSKVWYKDTDLGSGNEAVYKATALRIFLSVSTILNFASSVLLLVTAAIYYRQSNLRDLLDSCYFYFCLMAGIAHSKFTYLQIFREWLLPDMCLTNVYLLLYSVLSTMSWSTVTCYHIWRTTMNYHIDNEAKTLRHYKIFGFGFPFGLIFLVWVYVHIENIADLKFVLECYEHEKVIAAYISFPAIFLISSNVFLFIHSQVHIWSLHSIQSQSRKLKLKILKYRLFMNSKLFFVMGMPWALTLILNLIKVAVEFEFESSLLFKIIQYFLLFLIFGEGIPVFFILVIFRKRVFRVIVNKYFANTKILPDKWRTAKDSETEEEITDNETPPRSLEAKYTSNNTDNDKNIHDESAIVIL